MGKKIISRLLPVFGILFVTAYIRSAALNVVYTDYIRLVNSYLGNVFSFMPYMHADILTRIPVNYFERIINVVFFHYSTMFDMMLGAFGLGCMAFIIASFCTGKQIPWYASCLILFLIFSLNKWEMLTNGSGWVHFAAFALFSYHYYVYDRFMSGNGKKGDGRKLCVLPWIIILLFAGPYCAVYAVTMILADIFMTVRKKQNLRECLPRILNMLVPLVLYMASRACSVEDISGITSSSLSSVIASNPGFLPLLFIRSFSSMLVGGETAASYGIPIGISVLFGLFVIFCYGYAFYLNMKEKLYEKSTFPLILLVSGFLNHVLIALSRWMFLNNAYGMSSRYALQFEMGIIGIFLTVFMVRSPGKNGESGKRGARKAAAVLISLLFFAGNLVTTGNEIRMAPYRQENFSEIREAGLKFETLSDPELSLVFEYHDGAKVREALTLLKERKLNIYR